MKGIILAGGTGSRLRPLTDFVCKQLLPVYDKPLIYYPLTTLILSGIKDILIISTPEDLPKIKCCMGDGALLGVRLSYAVQDTPRGLADAFIVGEKFIDNHPVCMILGDNILYKAKLSEFMMKSFSENRGATIFSFPVQNPQRFGVVEMAIDTNQVLSLEEKPSKPKSNLASIGLYVYDENVTTYAKSLAPSHRGEIEITDLNKMYLEKGLLDCKKLSRGDIWIDAGVVESFSDASNLMRLIETRMGMKIGSPEEASYVMDNISKNDLKALAENYKNSPYGAYLKRVADE